MKLPKRIATCLVTGICVAALFLVISGCASSPPICTAGGVVALSGQGPVRHFLVIGFGLVSVKLPDEQTAVMACDQTSLGLYAGDLPGIRMGIGYQQSTTTIVPDGLKADDVRIEVVRKPLGTIEIRPLSGILKKPDENRPTITPEKEIR